MTPLINKFLKDLNLSKKDKEKLKEIIEVLKLKEEDFKSQDKKLMIDPVKENFKFNENKILSVCEINTLNVDVDLNTDVFISILSNFTIEDFEENLRSKGVNNIKGL